MKKGHYRFKIIFTALTALLFAAILFAACSETDGGETNTTPDKERTYTVTFITQTDGYVPPLKLKEGESVLPPQDDPERDGYRFKGWFLDDAPYDFGLMPKGNLVLIAGWDKYYAVVFETGSGGTRLDPLYFCGGDRVIIPDTIPQKSHNKFLGWTYGGGNYIPDIMPYSDVLLVAAWQAGVTISFNTGIPDLAVNPIIERAGTAVSAPPKPIRAGYTLARWLLNGVTYTFSVMPEDDITLTADWVQYSSLPSLFIDLYNNSGAMLDINSVQKDPYVRSKVAMENTVGGSMDFERTDADFKGRGNGSWSDGPIGGKKGYRIKFDTKQRVLGFPSSRHWVILACVNFDDRTLMKNGLAFSLGREVLTDIPWTSNAAWVDVYFNGKYHGVYLLAEQVRVDNDRIDIESGYDTSPEDTGYHIEYDFYAPQDGQEGITWFRADQYGAQLNHAFSVKSPEPDEIPAGGTEKFRAQIAYIRDYTSRAMSAIMTKDYAGFTRLCDEKSFVDMFILHELFKNKDVGWSSLNLMKKPGSDGKLYMTAPWDFDASVGANVAGQASPQGYFNVGTGAGTNAAQSNGQWQTHSQMYISLWDTQEQSTGVYSFREAVKARWREVSADIESVLMRDLSAADFVEPNKFAFGRNFYHYRDAYGIWYNTQTKAEDMWVGSVNSVRNWFRDRIVWLNGEWGVSP